MAHNKTPPLLFRSVLYVPAIKEKALSKVNQLTCDAVIIDLEDSVSPQEKPQARIYANQYAKAGSFDNTYSILRINALDTEEAIADIEMINDYPCDAILIPKIRNEDDIQALQKLKSQDIFFMVETPLMIMNLHALITYTIQQGIRLKGLVVGTNDFSKDTEIPLIEGRNNMTYALQKIALCAKAHNIIAIDGVYNHFNDDKGCTEEAKQGYAIGFDGKTLIHPKQIPIANTIFLPDAEHIDIAKSIIHAFSLPENAEKNVINVNGKMVERLHYEMALKTIKKVDIAQAMEKKS